jgi:hypothetical protein
MSMKNWRKLATGVYAQPLTQDEIQARKPRPKAKAKPPLDPEYANRKILALKAMLRESDITEADFRRLKAGIISRVVS